MQTRSQTRYSNQVFSVDIDFDAASAAWKQNKRSIGNGCYVYRKERKEKEKKQPVAAAAPPAEKSGYNLRSRSL